MARTQAADYEARRAGIVEKAARLFARQGFARASVSDLARMCRTSKSLIYHYYPSKEDILFDVMHSHVAALLDAARIAVAKPGSPADILRDLTLEFMRLYAGAAARQKVLLNELENLPKERRAAIVAIQRRLVDIVRDVLVALRPGLAGRPDLERPAAMLYFGMINWTHTWMDASGAVSPSAIAEFAAEIFIMGFGRAGFPRAVHADERSSR
ncbi:MAG TPA: TetR/AcrR family transcriptional regulator [Rhizomicrobium sp.]|jgi:AcrR family transcriptional regulator|nr:TetR/AcrR family transcriptional regulator [Rhizomicrobium sp.]